MKYDLRGGDISNCIFYEMLFNSHIINSSYNY